MRHRKHKIQNDDIENIGYAIEQLRENATNLQRDPAGNKIRKLIKTRAIHRKINQRRLRRSEQERDVANENASWSIKHWVELANVIRNTRNANSLSTNKPNKSADAGSTPWRRSRKTTNARKTPHNTQP